MGERRQAPLQQVGDEAQRPRHGGLELGRLQHRQIVGFGEVGQVLVEKADGLEAAHVALGTPAADPRPGQHAAPVHLLGESREQERHLVHAALEIRERDRPGQQVHPLDQHVVVLCHRPLDDGAYADEHPRRLLVEGGDQLPRQVGPRRFFVG